MADARNIVKQLADNAGFALCGVAPAEPSDYVEELRQWLAAGKQGEMQYLAEHFDVRVDPRGLLSGAKSVICVADRLPTPMPTERVPDRAGRLARYVHVTDYHKVIKKRLFTMADAMRDRWPDERFRVCVDTAPILEREYAMRAGLGWTGKHTLLLNARLGSHVMLGEIVTTLEVGRDVPETDHCGTCRRCIEACPTHCITPYSVDASRCISYLTIEHRSEIAPSLHEAMGDWLYGCDVCQAVCPFVRKAEAERPAAMPADYESKPHHFDLLTVLSWREDDRREAFVKSAMKRAKLPMMKRNALIAAGNYLRHHDDEALRDRIRQIAADPTEPALVRRTAQQQLG